jgi:hypothetical protein
MGLDMYLRARNKKTEKLIPKKYLEYRELKDEEQFIEEQGKDKVFDLIMRNCLFPVQCTYSKYVYLSTHLELGYWRKANAIHKWFVDNVQDGVDDCDEYVVSKAQLSQLRDLCKEVIESLENSPTHMVQGRDGVYSIEEFINISTAKKLLPTTDGFFFGDSHYTKYYLEDLRETVRICDKVMYQVDDNWDITYHSSW